MLKKNNNILLGLLADAFKLLVIAPLYVNEDTKEGELYIKRINELLDVISKYL